MASHRSFLDDVRMTGVDVVTGEDVPLIVLLGSSTANLPAQRREVSWDGRDPSRPEGIERGPT